MPSDITNLANLLEARRFMAGRAKWSIDFDGHCYCASNNLNDDTLWAKSLYEIQTMLHVLGVNLNKVKRNY